MSQIKTIVYIFYESHNKYLGTMWCHTPVITAVGKPTQEDHKLQASWITGSSRPARNSFETLLSPTKKGIVCALQFRDLSETPFVSLSVNWELAQIRGLL